MQGAGRASQPPRGGATSTQRSRPDLASGLVEPLPRPSELSAGSRSSFLLTFDESSGDEPRFGLLGATGGLPERCVGNDRILMFAEHGLQRGGSREESRHLLLRGIKELRRIPSALHEDAESVQLGIARRG